MIYWGFISIPRRYPQIIFDEHCLYILGPLFKVEASFNILKPLFRPIDD